MSDDILNEPATSYDAVEQRSEFAPLIDELYREEVMEARRMLPDEKFLLGEELFEYACSITLAGIRHQNPDFSEAECEQELERRLQLKERLEQRHEF